MTNAWFVVILHLGGIKLLSVQKIYHNTCDEISVKVNLSLIKMWPCSALDLDPDSSFGPLFDCIQNSKVLSFW